tara:strand:+ start:330 stop:509 length:180 start_codon:yes stop_codon:yes gene_type:complete
MPSTQPLGINIMKASELHSEIIKARNLFNKDPLPVIDADGNYSQTFIALGLLLDQRNSI